MNKGGGSLEYIAHINESDKTVQTVREHSENTAKLSRSYSISDFKDIAFAAGLLHDIGKFESDFQRRIRGENIHVEHSIDGAIEADRLYEYPVNRLLAYCIAGHHSGLPDGGNKNDEPDFPTLYGRLQRKEQSLYKAYKEEIQIPDIDEKGFKKLLTQDCNNVLFFLPNRCGFH